MVGGWSNGKCMEDYDVLHEVIAVHMYNIIVLYDVYVNTI